MVVMDIPTNPKIMSLSNRITVAGLLLHVKPMKYELYIIINTTIIINTLNTYGTTGYGTAGTHDKLVHMVHIVATASRW